MAAGYSDAPALSSAADCTVAVFGRGCTGGCAAGDAFCAGLTIGLTYRKELSDAVEIGTKLAASVITSSENVCPRFLPRELGLDMDVSDC